MATGCKCPTGCSRTMGLVCSAERSTGVRGCDNASQHSLVLRAQPETPSRLTKFPAWAGLWVIFSLFRPGGCRPCLCIPSSLHQPDENTGPGPSPMSPKLTHLVGSDWGLLIYDVEIETGHSKLFSRLERNVPENGPSVSGSWELIFQAGNSPLQSNL